MRRGARRGFVRALLAILLVVPLAAAAVPLAANPWLGLPPLNMAHQGGETEAPSDTMYAFRTAVAKGADVLEMDVHRTVDGHIMRGKG